jgi:hypothetical protein
VTDGKKLTIKTSTKSAKKLKSGKKTCFSDTKPTYEKEPKGKKLRWLMIGKVPSPL